MNVSAVRRALVVVVLATTVVGLRPGSAAAFSCDPLDPIEASDTDPGVVELGDGVGAMSGSVAPDGDRLSMLVTLDGRNVDPYGIMSSHVMTLDAADDVPVTGSQPLASPDDSDTAEERQALSADDGRSGTGLVVGLGVLLLVLGVGLRAVKRQRDEGRRSKLPPIG